MANPGLISLQNPPDTQTIYQAKVAPMYRLTNNGPATLEVHYTDASNTGKSNDILRGRSMDYFATRILVQVKGTSGTAAGTYEFLA